MIKTSENAYDIGFYKGVSLVNEYYRAVEGGVEISPYDFFEGYLDGWRKTRSWDYEIGRHVRRLAGCKDAVKDPPGTYRDCSKIPKDLLDDFYHDAESGLLKGFLWMLEERRTHDLRMECPNAVTVSFPPMEWIDIRVCPKGGLPSPGGVIEALKFVDDHKNRNSYLVFKTVIRHGTIGGVIVVKEVEIDPIRENHTSYWGFYDDKYAIIWDVEGITDSDAVSLLEKALHYVSQNW